MSTEQQSKELHPDIVAAIGAILLLENSGSLSRYGQVSYVRTSTEKEILTVWNVDEELRDPYRLDSESEFTW